MIAVAQQERNRSQDTGVFPFSYQSIEIKSGTRPVGFRFSISITDISATLNGHELVVCGESEDHGISFDKATSELIERSALVTYGSIFGAKTSNGWAAHPDREQARRNAIYEIVERDAVLSQWYSQTPFMEIPKEEIPLDIQAWVLVELSRSEFPILKLLVSTVGLGPSVTCLLMNKDGFGVSAHATKKTLSESIASSIAEACRAAHLALRKSFWKDTLKLKDGSDEFVDPSAHSLFYAYHESLPEWMFGNFQRYEYLKKDWVKRLDHALADNLFIITEVMKHPSCVGFAKHPEAFELRWQSMNQNSVAEELAFRRLNLKKEELNKKPHIVS